MVTRSEGLLYDIGQGASALDAQAARDRLDGYAVVSGLGVSVATGLDLDVAAGTATVGETSGSVDTVSLGSTTTVSLGAADSTHPRKDVIYIDTNGAIQAETGTPEAAEPSGNTRFNTYVPEPPFPSTEGTILAEVWVPAGASSLQSGDVRDRRQPADVVGDRAVVRTVESDSVNTNQADITNETYIRARLGTSITGISAGTYTNIVDTEDDDVRNEFNSSQFSPDTSGDYRISGTVAIANQADGDRLQVKVQNVTDTSLVDPILLDFEAGGGQSSVVVPFGHTYTLDSAKAYEIQARDNDSSFDLNGGGLTYCNLKIAKEVVHA